MVRFHFNWYMQAFKRNLISFHISGGIYGAAWSALRIPDPHPTPLILQSFIQMKNCSILAGMLDIIKINRVLG